MGDSFTNDGREWVERSNNTVRIDGKGKKMSEILFIYENYIEEGYNLTIDEIANYTSSSYRFALQAIKPHIPHINVTRTIRVAVMRDLERSGRRMDPDKLQLLQKRILLERPKFKSYMLERLKKELKFDVVPMERFTDHSGYNELTEVVPEKANHLSILRKASLDVHKEDWKMTFDLQSVQTLPDRLFSLQDLKKLRGFRHNAEVYNFINMNGVNKFRFGNMVRYDLADFEANQGMIPIPYGHHINDVIDRVLEQAIAAERFKRAVRAIGKMAKARKN